MRERKRADLPIEVQNQKRGQRRENQRRQRQPPGDEPGAAQAGEDPQRLGDGAAVKIGDAAGQHVGRVRDVGREAADAVPIEARPIERERLVENPAANVAGNALRHVRHEHRVAEHQELLERRGRAPPASR